MTEQFDLSIRVDGPHGFTRMRRTFAGGGLGEALTLALVELAEKSDEPGLARIAEAAYRELQAIRGDGSPTGFPYRQRPACCGPASFIGSSKARQMVGDPGHCEDCVSVGHVQAHPDLGCGDVGCYRDH